ncbi:MAG: oxygen-dependent coproporphyrinogen oxidase [Mariprofundaceae bacterium]
MNDMFERAGDYFQDLRDRICTAFESLDTAIFERTSWDREEGGGGVMSVMRGTTFEKVGVNFSSVHGKFSDEFRRQIPGAAESGEFRACGISLVAHLTNPKCPAVHMNLRRIETSQGWFGGGTDLTPYFPYQGDTDLFHAQLKAACDQFDPQYYPEYKAWCDRYFFLPHRNEPRGVGGIFFDNFDSGDIETDFQFVQAVGEAFVAVYPEIVARRKNEPFTKTDREHQLVRRGRYVEFNLLYDRGTTFGLKTGGNTEAILMSMPPEVKWP